MRSTLSSLHFPSFHAPAHSTLVPTVRSTPSAVHRQSLLVLQVLGAMAGLALADEKTLGEFGVLDDDVRLLGGLG